MPALVPPASVAPPPTAPTGPLPGSRASVSDTTAPPPPGATTTSTPTTTTAAAPPVDSAQLAALVQGLDGDLARAQAIAAYQAARTAAAQLVAGEQPHTVADPVLVEAATTQLQATATRAAAQDAFDQARRRINQVSVALYVGVQVHTDARPLSATAATRSQMLSMILDGTRVQLRAAHIELKRADDEFDKSRRHADDLVNARATALEVKAQSDLTTTTTAAPASTSTTAPAPSTATAPGGRPASSLPPGLVAKSPTILGPSLLTADEMLGWYNASGHQPHLTVPLADLLREYQTRGAADGVRADMAFAQAVLETGYLGFPGYGQVSVGDNNFAGIGACDSCATGSRFPDAATGVAAHLQLLHAYATTQPLAGPMPGPSWVAGCCPTWLGLTGVWATAPNYGFSILKTYRSMVVWALGHRSASAGL